MGEEHVAPMVAFGTFKKKSAFKMYAKSQKMNFDLANEISKQITQYEEDLKNAEEDEELDLYDYIDEQYKSYIEKSEKYWGIVTDKKKAPSAYLLYQGNIRREIGLMKCKSDSTKKEVITCVIDGTIAENYKFLKNDILKVDSALLIDKVFKRIGIEHFGSNDLLEKIKNDKDVWELYANGYTIGVNQVEQVGSRHKCMNYKPKNISELSAFVAAIRPGFKSMYSKFERREDFRWGIDTLDNLIRTEELPVSFLFFQEQVMKVLHYAGFPMDQCYGIIKAIAKKHPEKVKPLKEKFIEGFKQKILEDEDVDEEQALDYSKQVWQIVNDNCGYSFNSSHAYCMAIDSSYQAWQKVHYPYEFYEVLLQHYTDKGNKNKVSLLKAEMKEAFGISEGEYKFRTDNRYFRADKDNSIIYPSLSSIKGFSLKASEDLYALKDNEYDDFIPLLKDIKNTSVNSKQLGILIGLNYFEEFGEINELYEIVRIFNQFNGKKVIKKNGTDIPEYLLDKYSCKETEKQYRFEEDGMNGLIKELVNKINVKKASVKQIIKWEIEYLQYNKTIFPKAKSQYHFVKEIVDNKTELFQLKTGKVYKIKFRKKDFNKNPFKEKDIIKITFINQEPKWFKDKDGEWCRDYDNLEDILKEWEVVQ